MNRQELQNISKIRRKEALTLLKAKRYAGAYYLIGYSIECAFKSCIAKQTRKYDFPNKELTNRAHTHKLERLLRLAGLEPALRKDMKQNRKLEVNWAIVKDWVETSRYDITLSYSQARDLYYACTARKNGILNWVRKKW